MTGSEPQVCSSGLIAANWPRADSINAEDRSHSRRETSEDPAKRALTMKQQAADLLFYVEHGYLVVQEPAETESWWRRKRLEEMLRGEAA